MRFISNASGVERLRKNLNYKPKEYRKKIYVPYGDKKESEDTTIRKDIYVTIINMMKENKSDIEIEIYLKNKYPDYAEIIPKFIRDQFSKRASNKKEKLEIKETGNER